MTVSDTVPALRAPSLLSALGTLRGRGMRISTARRHVLEALYAAEGPLTAEQLAAAVPNADLASVYRNLDVLEELGLVNHMHLGHGPGRYALARIRAVEFVTCEDCGAFEAIDAQRLDTVRAAIERETGFAARFTHFPIVGLCPACLTAPDERALHAHS